MTRQMTRQKYGVGDKHKMKRVRMIIHKKKKKILWHKNENDFKTTI